MDKTVYTVKKETVPADHFGLPTLLGKTVLIFTSNYIYYGTLHCVNCDFIELANPHIVYETGSFQDKKLLDAQPTGSDSMLIGIGFIESAFQTEKTK